MHTPHHGPIHDKNANWVPTIALAWMTFGAAALCAFLAITAIAPPMLAVFGMAVFGVISILFVMLTVTR
jgi:purine-cytosine permease-like protein